MLGFLEPASELTPQLVAGLARKTKMIKFLSGEDSPLLAAESFN
jgi:hypothetical protein